ncbi:MAG: T9SS type A sorting domain-containing protein [Bacteroidales bacterium]|nr:T9SS type A sorting domain-containing protein [Bacteroidales bacterium]
MQLKICHIQKILILKAISLLIILMAFSPMAGAQQLFEKNKAVIIGQVLNTAKGSPIIGQEMELIADSSYNPSFIYSSKLYTDKDGYFFDTVYTHVNKGAIIISTRDYMNVRHDTTLYFRFDWSEQNILLANFYLPIELTSTAHYASFEFVSNPNGTNELEYQFYDKTDPTNVIQREWNFGDGNFSYETNPAHTYDHYGLYKVKLTVSFQAFPGGEITTSYIVKYLNIVKNQYFHMGGHVFAGMFPIDMGRAYLYKIENNEILLLDTAIFNDTLGYFLFYQLIEGEYIVKARPDSNSTMIYDYLPTYYSNNLLWTEADTIFHFENNYNYDIHLVPKGLMSNGPGMIGGIISYGSDTDGKDFYPAENMEILLFNEDNEPMVCCYSNCDGHFEFCDMPLGNYTVYAEITGKQTFPVNIVLSEDNCELTDLQFVITSSSVHGSLNVIGENQMIDFAGNIYPNPARESICIDFSMNRPGVMSISIIDKTGQIIQNESTNGQAGKNRYSIDISALQSGIYFLRLGNQKQGITRKFIVL